jgi:hypothetical protein
LASTNGHGNGTTHHRELAGSTAAQLPGRRALSLLPTGAIRPQGFWRQIGETVANGWLGRLIDTNDADHYAAPWERLAHVDYRADGHTETAGYVGDAIVRLGHLLPGTRSETDCRTWVERVLASQDPDGYIGCSLPENRFKGYFEIWPMHLLLGALVADYEATNDGRVLTACREVGHWFARELDGAMLREMYSRPKLEGQAWQSDHAVNIISSLAGVYEHTGDETIREAALEILRDSEQDGFSAAGVLAGRHSGYRRHVVNTGMQVVVFADTFRLTGDRKYLDAAEKLYHEVAAPAKQASGVPAGNEFISMKGPRKWTEHCGTVEWTIAGCQLAALTGDVAYADDAERCFYNAYFGSRSKDGHTLTYNHAPNQITAGKHTAPYEDNWDQAWFRGYYSANCRYICCNGNTSRAFPNFARHAVATAADGGPAVVLYGACEVDHPTLPLRIETEYPFEDAARIVAAGDSVSDVTLRLRIPTWCHGATITVNGEAADVHIAPGSFAAVRRQFREGDVVEIAFEIGFELDVFDESWWAVPGFAVQRGPLTFVRAVPEDWQPIDGEAEPCIRQEEMDVHFAVEEKNPEKPAWNYALVLDVQNPDDALELVRGERDASKHPFEDAAWRVRVPAVRVTDWEPDVIMKARQTPMLPNPPMATSDEMESIELVPFGSTNLRMCYLPVRGIESVRTNPDGTLTIV